MRNIGKRGGLALVVAVAPLFSMCNQAEQAQPKSYVSPNEAWSRLQRTLWPTPYVQAIPVPVGMLIPANRTNATDACAANPGAELRSEGAKRTCRQRSDRTATDSMSTNGEVGNNLG